MRLHKILGRYGVSLLLTAMGDMQAAVYRRFSTEKFERNS